jgi:hypothetical protein
VSSSAEEKRAELLAAILNFFFVPALNILLQKLPTSDSHRVNSAKPENIRANSRQLQTKASRHEKPTLFAMANMIPAGVYGLRIPAGAGPIPASDDPRAAVSASFCGICKVVSNLQLTELSHGCHAHIS